MTPELIQYLERIKCKAKLESAVDGDGPAEAHAAEHLELRAAFQQEPDDLEEVLVPADGDAIFGDDSETGQDGPDA